MADHHDARATTWAELQAAHARFFQMDLPEMLARMAEGDRSMGAVALRWDTP